ESGKPPRSTIRITGGPGGVGGRGTVPTNGGAAEGPSNSTKVSLEPDTAPDPKNYPFIVGERLNYDISWSKFPSVGKASFEVRQQGTLNGNRVIEFFGEAASVGTARSLVNVNDQVSSVVLFDSLMPIKTELRLREGKRSKQSTANYNRTTNRLTLSGG